MLLENIFPTLPTGLGETFLLLSGILGMILLVYSQFVEAEHRRDLIRFLGAGGLLTYSIYIGNVIFILVSTGVGIAALIEWIEIYLGFHRHTPDDVKEYIKKYKKKQ